MGLRKRYLTLSGETIWVDVAVGVARTPDGVIDHFVAQIVDVTAEVVYAEALERTVRRFRHLAENASDVVYETDAEWRIQWISPSVQNVLGWQPEMLVGTSATDLIAPGQEDLLDVRQRQIHGGYAVGGDLLEYRDRVRPAQVDVRDGPPGGRVRWDGQRCRGGSARRDRGGRGPGGVVRGRATVAPRGGRRPRRAGHHRRTGSAHRRQPGVLPADRAGGTGPGRPVRGGHPGRDRRRPVRREPPARAQDRVPGRVVAGSSTRFARCAAKRGRSGTTSICSPT